MSAWVSPPQESVSHMVEVAAIIAHAASTALPPCSKILAPAVAARGLPVTAIQCRPCRAGFCVRPCACGPPKMTLALTMAVIAPRAMPPALARFLLVFLRIGMRSSLIATWVHVAAMSIWQTSGRANGERSVRLPGEVHAWHCPRAGASRRHRLSVGPSVDGGGCEGHVPEPAHPSAPGAHRARDHRGCAGTERSRDAWPAGPADSHRR